jgi:phosphatidylinositol-3-phosphatase
VIVMENKDCNDVIGSRQAPYLNALAQRYSFASRHFALRKPSLPNYLGLTGGSTFGITTDCTECSVSSTNLVDQLEGAGITWKAYMQGMPLPCFAGAESGLYVKRHNPFVYYSDIVSRPMRCGRVVPLNRLSRDLARRTLPRFVWISPDICDDMHSCTIRTGDRFLSRLVPPLLRALGPRGVLFVTWDEGYGGAGCCGRARGGNVALIVAGASARSNARSGLAYDHYSVLRTIEDAFALPRLRAAGCPCTRSLAPLLR